ncbi:MAG: TIR domain-containing protein, partial [Phototrophicaceae bacterium]
MARIFFSYRRTDSLDTTKKLYRQFERSFGIWRFFGAQKRNLFLDKDNIMPKGDFRAQIQRFIIESDHMLVIIGNTWLDEIQHRKANNITDFVLIEIDSAFIHRVNVIPVLLNDTQMPSRDQLPDEIKQLATQHAHRIHDANFVSDTEQLIKYTRPAMPFHILSIVSILLLLLGVGFFISEIFPQTGPQPSPTTQIAQVQPTTGQEALETVFAQQTSLSLTEQAFNQTATIVRVQNATA